MGQDWPGRHTASNECQSDSTHHVTSSYPDASQDDGMPLSAGSCRHTHEHEPSSPPFPVLSEHTRLAAAARFGWRGWVDWGVDAEPRNHMGHMHECC